MFDRFTADARQAIVASQEAARAQGHDRIGTRHLRAALQGRALEGAADEHAALARLGLGAVDARLVEEPPPIPFDDDVKSCLVQALELAGDGPVGLDQLRQAVPD
jgi:hypothetical protein